MRFLITAYDSKESGTLDKRMSIRPQHLENILSVKEYGSVICAGALTNDNDQVIGSYLVMEFENQELLQRYLNSEPYIKQGVWEKVNIEKCKIAIKDDKLQK